MKTARLGRRGPEITRLGFGAWAIGGPWRFGWGRVDDAESIAAIRRAVDAGVNWIDTAAVYGYGHSEEVVGKAIQPYSIGDDLYVFTKCGLNWYDTDDGEQASNLRPEGIRYECEQSLKRLGIETIDLYQFHWPDDATGTAIEDSWGTMGELIDEGKVRWGGVSNFDVGLLERCEKVRHVDSLQPHLSLIDRRAAADVIPWCAEHGTGVIVYSPMESGLLTGKFSAAHVASLDDTDWRKRDPRFNEPQLSENLALVDRMRPIAERLGTSIPALAVAWTLHVEGVTAAIAGARNPEQVNGWIDAAEIELDEATLAELEGRA